MEYSIGQIAFVAVQLQDYNSQSFYHWGNLQLAIVIDLTAQVCHIVGGPKQKTSLCL